jgi:hypothetical protein
MRTVNAFVYKIRGEQLLLLFGDLGTTASSITWAFDATVTWVTQPPE